MLAVLAMLILGAAQERRRRAEAVRVIALDEVRRAARAAAYAAELEAACARYRSAVVRLHAAHPTPDCPERDAVAAAAHHIDTIMEVSWDR